MQPKLITEIPKLYVFLCPFMTVLFYVAYGSVICKPKHCVVCVHLLVCLYMLMYCFTSRWQTRSGVSIKELGQPMDTWTLLVYIFVCFFIYCIEQLYKPLKHHLEHNYEIFVWLTTESQKTTQE